MSSDQVPAGKPSRTTLGISPRGKKLLLPDETGCSAGGEIADDSLFRQEVERSNDRAEMAASSEGRSEQGRSCRQRRKLVIG
jgi:hypothetical protein